MTWHIWSGDGSESRVEDNGDVVIIDYQSVLLLLKQAWSTGFATELPWKKWTSPLKSLAGHAYFGSIYHILSVDDGSVAGLVHTCRDRD